MDSRPVGREAVRRALVAAWQADSDVQWLNGQHFVQGEFAILQWTFVGTGLMALTSRSTPNVHLAKSPEQTWL